MPLQDDALDTTAHGVPYVPVAPLPSLRGRVWRVATTPFITRVCPYPFAAVVRTVTVCHKGDTLRSLGQGTTQV